MTNTPAFVSRIAVALLVAAALTACAVEDDPLNATTQGAVARPGRAMWGVVLGGITYSSSTNSVNMVDRPDAIACDLAQLGAGWVRLDVGAGDGDMAPFARFIRAAHARSVRVLLLVHPDNFAVDPVDLTHLDPRVTSWTDAYAARLNALIDGPLTGTARPDAIEIGNEPNGGQSDINAGAFAVLLDRVWRQVKRAPHAGGSPLIVAGGVLGAWVGQPWWQSYLYHLDLLHRAGGEQPWDAFAFHPYNGDVYRNQGAQAWTDSVRSNIADLQSNLRRIYGADSRLWVTEIGWDSSRTNSHGDPVAPFDDAASDENEQAALFERADDTLAGLVENAFWYVYRDDEIEPGTEYGRKGVRQNAGGHYAPKALYGRMAARIGGAGDAATCYATGTPPPSPPSSGALVFASGDARRTTSTGDWRYGAYKAECGGGQAVTGLSAWASTPHVAHAALCSGDDAARYPHASCGVRSLAGGDDRATGATGDWDYGYVKAECGANEYAAGLAQTPDHRMSGVLCCAGAVAHSACAALPVTSGDRREAGTSGDWDVGYFKAECGPGRYVAGVSRDVNSGLPHAILCCGG